MATSLSEGEDHPVPLFETPDVRPDLLDNTGGFVTKDYREWR